MPIKEKYIDKICKKHKTTKYVLEGRGSYRCVKCRAAGVTKWRKNKKRRLVVAFGGKCTIYGYSKTVEALHFHHKDPDTKSFGTASGKTRAYDTMVKEAEKCILLCANCHSELHNTPA